MFVNEKMRIFNSASSRKNAYIEVNSPGMHVDGIRGMYSRYIWN